MSIRTKQVLCLGAFLSVFAPAVEAAAQQCCPGFTPSTCPSSTVSIWCVQSGAPDPGSAALASYGYCKWGDEAVTALATVFGVPAPGIFEFDVEWPANGGAHTGTNCSNFGDGFSGDALTNTAFGVAGFYGYLFSLHEGINDWTGMVSGGWPTDWWADHVSAFPNTLDWLIMQKVGTDTNNATILKAAQAQHDEWLPSGSGNDPRVVALYNVINLMPNMDGLGGFKHVLQMVSGDGRNDWGTLGTNPNEKLSEYVLAYMALAVGQQGNQVLKTMQGPGANGGGNVCNGFQDSSNDPTYMCSEANIDAIATAHCALHANGNDSADQMALLNGNYMGVKMGPCGSTCPAECGCDMSTMSCVAPWVAMNGGSSGGDAGSGSTSSSGSTGSSGSTSSSTSSGASSSGGTSGSGSGSSTGSGTGTSGSTGGSSGTGSGASGSTGSGGAPSSGLQPSGSSGCSCRTLGDTGDSRALFAAICGLVALVFFRFRARAPRDEA